MNWLIWPLCKKIYYLSTCFVFVFVDPSVLGLSHIFLSVFLVFKKSLQFFISPKLLTSCCYVPMWLIFFFPLATLLSFVTVFQLILLVGQCTILFSANGNFSVAFQYLFLPLFHLSWLVSSGYFNRPFL